MSDDDRYSIVIIAFVGNVFSPFYFAERQRLGQADPMDFCAFNIGIYHKKQRVWGFTEWPRSHVRRSARSLAFGPNRLERDDDRVEIEVNETPLSGADRIEGRITVHLEHPASGTFHLDENRKHRWYPIAPSSRITVKLKHPDLRFRGHAYHDANEGDEPLEAAVRRWHWSRHRLGDDTVVFYDGSRIDDSPFSLALRFSAAGATPIDPAPLTPLSATRGWFCPRATRSDKGGKVAIINTMENSPFYARTLLETSLFGHSVRGIHESLSLDRFVTKWMQWMLPFRIRRA